MVLADAEGVLHAECTEKIRVARRDLQLRRLVSPSFFFCVLRIVFFPWIQHSVFFTNHYHSFANFLPGVALLFR